MVFEVGVIKKRPGWLNEESLLQVCRRYQLFGNSVRGWCAPPGPCCGIFFSTWPSSIISQKRKPRPSHFSNLPENRTLFNQTVGSIILKTLRRQDFEMISKFQDAARKALHVSHQRRFAEGSCRFICLCLRHSPDATWNFASRRGGYFTWNTQNYSMNYGNFPVCSTAEWSWPKSNAMLLLVYSSENRTAWKRSHKRIQINHKDTSGGKRWEVISF